MIEPAFAPDHVAAGGASGPRRPTMLRHLAVAALIPLAAAIAACGGASFAETFPSPRRSPRPVAVVPAQPQGPSVPAGYATAPSVPPGYQGAPAYYGTAAPPPGYGAPAPVPGYGASGSAASSDGSAGPAASAPVPWDRPIPEPPGAAAPAGRCENTCDLANDGECDDGRAGAGSDLCMPGTDCADCGA